MAHAMIEVTSLSKRYQGKLALDAIDFQLRRGETLGLIGPNGAGKSTTVSIISGLMRPDSGQVSLAGIDLDADGARARRQLGLVPQELALVEDLTARENLQLFGALYQLHGKALRKRVEQALALMQLDDRAAEPVHRFSGGMKRRLNIAAALLHEPAVLILDEPSVGVDAQSRNAVLDTLEGLKAQGCSIVYTSHYMEEVERLADAVLLIDHGRVVVHDTPSRLRQMLPARAALEVDLEADPTAETLLALRALPGVTEVLEPVALQLRLNLNTNSDALPVLGWLQSQGLALRHFRTSQTNLEDIFLSLTGRALRE